MDSPTYVLRHDRPSLKNCESIICWRTFRRFVSGGSQTICQFILFNSLQIWLSILVSEPTRRSITPTDTERRRSRTRLDSGQWSHEGTDFLTKLVMECNTGIVMVCEISGNDSYWDSRPSSNGFMYAIQWHVTEYFRFGIGPRILLKENPNALFREVSAGERFSKL